MANMANQPLLDTPKKRSSLKVLYAVLSLIAILAGIAVVSVTFLKSTSQTNASLRSHLCKQAHDQSSCLAVLSEATSSGSKQSSDVDLLQMILAKSSSRIQETMKFADRVNRRVNDQNGEAALADCLELMDLSMDRVTDSMVALGSQTVNSHSDVHSWLSSVLTNHVTCLDGLNGMARSVMESTMNELISRAKTSLALVVAIAPPRDEEMLYKPLNGDFPSWITSKDRRLLAASAKNIDANLVVAKDGSGNYKTVQEAVNAAPNNAKTRYVIYVKKGTYKEKVDIGKSKKNLMLVGDGMDSTIITGSLNVVDGSTTFNSATVVSRKGIEMQEQVEMVGRAFVDHYYHLFDNDRTSLALLYQPTSMLTFEGHKIHGADDIITKLIQLPFEQCHHVISTIDAQPSSSFSGGGILVFVSGSLQLQGKDHPQKFSEMFHLIPTVEGRFFVQNDIFRLNYG